MTKLSRILVILLACITLSACTAKLVYRNLDWVVLEFVESYVSLNGDQEELLEMQLEDFASWHKRTELPKYQQQLQSLYNKDLSSVDNDFLVGQQQEFRSHIKSLAARITPDLYLLSRSLSDEQRAEFIKNLDEQQKEYMEEYSQMSESDIRERYLERIDKNLRRWLGDISPEQRQIAREWAQNIEITYQDWGMYRLNTRDRIKTLFARKDDPFFYQSEFTELMNQPERDYSDELLGKLERNRATANQSILAILSTVSDRQKMHFKSEIQDWLELVKDLQE
ncbi:hypothetical protein JCM19241_371 [Vibrio ishigakensis]|uniref:Lipoprotein n=1 Tax=Vibrio ishigakensis TaxID=1481914 RepID=A0A0B8QLY3_9VIBR|nr:hypothetical protein JCM19241_371 [Vibrio ishigakensis]